MTDGPEIHKPCSTITTPLGATMKCARGSKSLARHGHGLTCS
ncbi:MAG: DUF3761 domain-containing protein [Candidatus Thiodiazotropha sp. (ex Epidulcina cf. delphinae)]|nr:DUF3761 domain-containing protein [Candidatus Thiodiazotropha sp. (ex Epidulcina cf. delphinae)]